MAYDDDAVGIGLRRSQLSSVDAVNIVRLREVDEVFWLCCRFLNACGGLLACDGSLLDFPSAAYVLVALVTERNG